MKELMNEGDGTKLFHNITSEWNEGERERERERDRKK